MLGYTRRLVDMCYGKVPLVCDKRKRFVLGRLGVGEDAGPHGVYLYVNINIGHTATETASQEWAGSCRLSKSRVVCWLRNSRILQIARDLVYHSSPL